MFRTENQLFGLPDFSLVSGTNSSAGESIRTSAALRGLTSYKRVIMDYLPLPLIFLFDSLRVGYGLRLHVKLGEVAHKRRVFHSNHIICSNVRRQ